MVNAKIEELGLGDKVRSKLHGTGTVIKCTEKPSVVVMYFDFAITYTQKNFPEDLEAL